MAKKLLIKDIREAFAQRSFNLLSVEYMSSKSKLDFCCKQGHLSSISWDRFNQGSGCFQCTGSAKKTIDDIRAAFKEKELILTSDKYEGKDSLLKFVCDRGHSHSISWNSFRSGRGCGLCRGKIRKTIDQVRAAFEARGWTLKSDVYENAHKKLDFECENGHNHCISWGKFQMGQGCVYCAGLVSKTIEEVQGIFASKNWTLLSDVYANSKQRLSFKCENDHISRINLDNLNAGQGCSRCSISGFRKDKPAVLYYIRFENKGQIYYKIGITNRSLKKRFSSEFAKAKVLQQKHFALGSFAAEEERSILTEFDKYRYKGEPFLKYGGNTELFIKDVLNLDVTIGNSVPPLAIEKILSTMNNIFNQP